MSTIEVKEGHWFYGIWFVGGTSPMTGQSIDMLAAFFKVVDEDRWELRYRFRYHEDMRAFDSQDRKSGNTFTLPADRPDADIIAEAKEAVEGMIGMTDVLLMNVEERTFLLLETDDPNTIMEQMATQSWCHMQTGDDPNIDETQN